MTQRKILAGLDLGTAKTRALVLETDGGAVRALGFGTSVSAGIRKGVIVDIEQAAEAVRSAVDDAEESAGVRITRVIGGVASAHVSCAGSYGVVGVADRAVTALDRQKAIDAAGIMYVPVDREILHKVPNEFVLDGRDSIRNPVGMQAVRLEARILVVTAPAAEVQKFSVVCREAGLTLSRTVFGPLAAAGAVLTERERNEGAVLVDIGAGTTGIAVFRNGAPVHCAAVGVGGAHLTNDLAVGLRVTAAEAEELKLRHLSLAAQHQAANGTVRLGSNGSGREVSAADLLSIAGPRCAEMAALIRKEIVNAKTADAPLHVVLTGGASLLPGFSELAEKILGLPVRIGSPLMIQGMRHEARTPVFSAAVGLALAGKPEKDEAARETLDNGALSGLRTAGRRLTGLFRNLNFDKNKKGVRYV
ncbi:MAG: cell division protein FtsA [Thermodesulfovibrionales bacterium]